jgi:predicted DNA-binding antitoxin AbrB/MazE fold protein
MSQSVRAIYNQGSLRLLEPVDLAEGQEIRVVILSERERIRAALGDLLVQYPEVPDDDFDEEALAREIEEAFRGQPPLSETIIEERREGP